MTTRDARAVVIGDVIRFPSGEFHKVSAIDPLHQTDKLRFYWQSKDGGGYPANFFDVHKSTLIQVKEAVDWQELANEQPIVSEPVIDDYEVKVVFNDGTKTALYFKELDFIKDLGWTNVDRIVITARWK